MKSPTFSAIFPCIHPRHDKCIIRECPSSLVYITEEFREIIGAQLLQPFGLRPAPSLSTPNLRCCQYAQDSVWNAPSHTFPVALSATSKWALRGAPEIFPDTEMFLFYSLVANRQRSHDNTHNAMNRQRNCYTCKNCSSCVGQHDY